MTARGAPAATIHPFRIAVPDEALSSLRQRLEQARLPDQPADVGWEQGMDVSALRGLVRRWLDGFDWRVQEAALNALPQFRVEFEGGQQLHFVHVRAANGRGLPLLLTHGWPGSFAEFTKIIPLLTDPGRHGLDPDCAFDVVVPSLPGYGFSSRPDRTGASAFAIAELWASLMTALGYDRYGAQGGDWGASVTTALALAHPDRIAGIHLNFIPGSFSTAHEPSELTEEERAALSRRATWADREGGYGHVQGTKPQTLAYALNDSPMGLLAWLAEKFQAWSDGGIGAAVSVDEVLTTACIYWFTQTIGSSMRLYWETRRRPLHFAQDQRALPPCAVARFPGEAPLPAQSHVARAYNLVRWRDMPKGGHFAALEQPLLLAEDVAAFFRVLDAFPKP